MTSSSNTVALRWRRRTTRIGSAISVGDGAAVDRYSCKAARHHKPAKAGADDHDSQAITCHGWNRRFS
jgi:hypothetical protein